MATKLITTLMILFSMMVQPVYGFDFLKELNPLSKKKDKVAKRTVKQNLKIVKNYDVSRFNREELKRVRKVLIEMGEKFEKNYNSTETSSNWNDYIEQSIESFLILKAHASNGPIPHGSTCPFGMYPSVSLWGKCDDPCNSQRYPDSACVKQAKASGCSSDQFPCPSKWFGANDEGKGICVPNRKDNEYTNACKTASEKDPSYVLSDEINGGGLGRETVSEYNSTAHSFQATCSKITTAEARESYGCNKGMNQLADTRVTALQRDVDGKISEIDDQIRQAETADDKDALAALNQRRNRLVEHQKNLENINDGKGEYAEDPDKYISAVKGDLESTGYNDRLVASQAATAGGNNTAIAEKDNAVPLVPKLKQDPVNVPENVPNGGLSPRTVSCGSFATPVENGTKCQCLHGDKQIVDESSASSCSQVPDVADDSGGSASGAPATSGGSASGGSASGEGCKNSIPDGSKCKCSHDPKLIVSPAESETQCQPDPNEGEKACGVAGASIGVATDGESGKRQCSCPAGTDDKNQPKPPTITWTEGDNPPDGVEQGDGESAPKCPSTAKGQSGTGSEGGQCGLGDDEVDLKAIENGTKKPAYAEMESIESGQPFPGTNPFESCQEMTTMGWDKVANRTDIRFKLAWHNLYKSIAGSGGESSGLEGAINEYKRAWQSYHGLNSMPAIPANGETVTAPSIQDGTNMANVISGQNNAQTLEADRRALENAGETLRGNIEDVVKEAKKLREKFERCAAVATMSNFVDFDDEDQVTPEYTVSSMDGKINCKTSGAETQDFGECKAGVTAYNAAVIGAKGMDIYDQVDMADFQMDQQLEMQKNMAAGANGDFTFALKAQKAQMEKGVEALQRRAVFSGVKLGVFTAVMMNMPTQKDLINQCKSKSKCVTSVADAYHAQLMAYLAHHLKEFTDKGPKITVKNVELRLGQILSLTGGGGGAEPTIQQNPIDVLLVEFTSANENVSRFTNTEKTVALPYSGEGAAPIRDSVNDDKGGTDEMALCAEAASADPGVALIQNEDARDAMKQEMMNAGAELLTQLLQMKILKDMIAKIEDALRGIQNLEPIPLTFTGEDLLTTLCSPEAFPQHPDCIGLDPNRTFGFPDQSFNISAPDPAGTNGGNLADNGNNNIDSAVGGNSDPNRRVRGNSRPIANIGKSGNGGLGNLGGGSGGTKGGGGLGGSGSAGGASASAPGGGGGGGGEGAAPGGSSKRGNVAYTGSSAGSLAYGTGRSSRKKKKAKNPFANFKKKNGSGGVLSFRNPAGIGSKSSNIFKMISNGYSRAVKRNQLLKYTEVKPKK